MIRSVLKLANKQVEKLPSPTTILNMNIERLILAQQQVKGKLPEENKLIIYKDETSKFGCKYSVYHVSDSSGVMYCLGLRQILTKSGHATLSVLKKFYKT